MKDPKKIVVCPGVFDGLTARIALSKAFDALYMVWAMPPTLYIFHGGGDGRTDYLVPSSDRRRNVNVEVRVGRPWNGDT